MTSREREKQVRPIRIPLLKGLLGHRVFIIKEKDQVHYSQKTTLSQLKQRVAGQGHDWPDTSILQANGFTVKTAVEYRSLFHMLEEGRFDFFPRGVNEVWEEIQLMQPRTEKLIIEQHLMLYYPAPIYFFVNKKNTKLATRIKTGLMLAHADGDFDKLINEKAMKKVLLKSLNFHQRRVFKLNNPLLPIETPLSNSAFWYTQHTRESQ